MKRRTWLWLLTSISLALSVCVCDCRGQKVVLRDVEIKFDDRIENLANPAAQEKVRNAIRSSIANSRQFGIDETTAKPSRLTIFVAKKPDADTNYLVANLEVRDGHMNQRLSVQAELAIGASGVVPDAEVESKIGEMLESLSQTLSERQALKDNPIKYLAMMTSGVEYDRAEALYVLDNLNVEATKEACPLLITALKTVDELGLASSVLMLLGECGGDGPMNAIIDFTERKPPIIRRQAIIAARKVASPLAAHWLLVMAYGHDDEQVRGEALDALHYVENVLQPLAQKEND